MKKLIFAALAFLMLLPNFAHADGGMMPSPDHYVYETGQKAVIVYQNKTETLVLSTSFQGDAKDFAYIVPTPSQPQVSKISDDIFQNLQYLIMPIMTEQPVPMMGLGGTDNLAEKSQVTVLEEKKVGVFEIKVLSSTSANALYTWLTENNFTYPQDKKYILDDYIQNKWYFTTAKISNEAISGEIQSKLYQGELSPLKLVFQTENLVFPLKISAVVDKNVPDMQAFSEKKESSQAVPDSSPESGTNYSSRYYGMPITLYIFADHKKEAAGFSTEYANWIKAADIEKLAKDDNGNPWVAPNNKMYLTKLTINLTNDKMTNDLELRN